MRRVHLNPQNVPAAIAEIERASADNDILDIAGNFSVDNAGFTQAFQVNTAAPNLTNLAQVLATLITVMKKGGLNRTT